MTAPRVRFAPSPTGYFHVGSARTALFNWLFARQQGGVFVLRIEDTDAERNREEWVDGILSAMAWLGMEPDEGPYRQSERQRPLRGGRRRPVGGRPPLRLRLHPGGDRGAHQGPAPPPATTATAGTGAWVGRAPGCPAVPRPRRGGDRGHDLIRGDVTFPHEAMEDFVVVKSNGQPLFVLANVVDDRDMAITHVIRGEDLLPTTPKGVLLWRALDAAEARPTAVALPAFAHLPMLVNEQRKKLSKRRDPVAVESYRDEGYLPEAFRNYLALLGWSPAGDAEKVDPSRSSSTQFRLEDVHHAPAFFDVAKLTHLNGEYIRDLTRRRVHRAQPALGGAGPGGVGAVVGRATVAARAVRAEDFAALAPLVQERVARLGEVPQMVDFVFLAEPADRRGRAGRRRWPATTAPLAILAAASAAYAALPLAGRRAAGGDRRRWPRRRVASSARPRRRSGWRSPGARSVRRCSSRWRCSGRDEVLRPAGRRAPPAEGRRGSGPPRAVDAGAVRSAWPSRSSVSWWPGCSSTSP